MRKKRLNRRGHEIIKTQKAMTISTLKPNSLIKRSLAGVDFFSLTRLRVCVCVTLRAQCSLMKCIFVTSTLWEF